MDTDGLGGPPVELDRCGDVAQDTRGLVRPTPSEAPDRG